MKTSEKIQIAIMSVAVILEGCAYIIEHRRVRKESAARRKAKASAEEVAA